MRLVAEAVGASYREKAVLTAAFAREETKDKPNIGR